MKNKKIYIGILVTIIIVIIVVAAIIIARKDKQSQQNDSTNNQVFVPKEPSKGDGGEATEEIIEKNFKLEPKDIPEEVDEKIQNTDQFYSDLKKYAYEKGLVEPDTITLGQCHEDENTVVIEYFLEKDNKVEYRIMATINKQDNTYKFEYYM